MRIRHLAISILVAVVLLLTIGAATPYPVWTIESIGGYIDFISTNGSMDFATSAGGTARNNNLDIEVDTTWSDGRYLYKENTSPFTPDADYEPATKKYVDDNMGGVGAGFFGDGSDGDVTISGDTTLTRDMMYNDLTVNNGVTLTARGYKIFVKGTLTNNGTITASGNDGNVGTDGANATGGGGGAGGAGGATGTQLASALYSITGGSAGSAGSAGGDGQNGNGDNGSNGTSPGATTNSFGSAGSDGVAGGNGGNANGSSGGTGGTAGTGGAATVTAPVLGSFRNIWNFSIWRLFSPTGNPIIPNYHGSTAGGGGGGGGAGSGMGSFGGGGGGAAGSGSSAGCIYIAAKTLTNSGTGRILAEGGDGNNGGNGGNGYAFGGGSGAGGGGGAAGSGGSGGCIVLIYCTYTNSGTVSVVGGSPGSVGTGGTGVGGADDGDDGSAGNTGTAGEIIELDLAA